MKKLSAFFHFKTVVAGVMLMALVLAGSQSVTAGDKFPSKAV